MAMNSRVCDRCIRFVSGDLKRPHCTRCSEVGLTCTYTLERRKPGPSRGARRQKHASLSSESNRHTSPGLVRNEERDCAVALDLMPTQSPLGDALALQPSASQTTPQTTITDFNQLDLNFSPYGSAVAHPESQLGYPGYHLESGQEREILVHFFDEVHAAVPLFQKAKFLRLYDDGLVHRDLVTTMVAVTAKILGPVSYWRADDVDKCINALLNTTSFERDLSSNFCASLDEFRQECLLVYYEFHQFPGPSAWMKISQLTRRAQVMGLNQIDNPELCSAFDSSLANQDEIEDWRCLWWCIYTLDSYSNISSGAPFIIDLDSINTALIRRSSNGDGDVPSSMPKLFLPDEMDQLWKTTQDIISSGCAVDCNIHMITTTMLRQAGNLLRLRTEGKRLPSRTASLKSSLATLRLSLPPRYLNPARNVLGAETNADHHTRLTNILHMHMARFVLALPRDMAIDETEWMDNWQQSLETCQDIVLAVEQWNNRFSPRVDPAICFIIFLALNMLELHRRSIILDSTSPLLANIVQGQNVLLLFLEQFSSMWAVPKVLIQQFRNFQTDTPLTYANIDRILNRYKCPLHPKTLQSSSPAILDNTEAFPSLEQAMYFSDMWSFNLTDPDL
ncbi:hypothetical protein F5X99DRAFT_418275 [Biscogniauxia marginata]|nr:hypothetical protein F5X99DRAFT_418275 [Biscogniauxia marginata]